MTEFKNYLEHEIEELQENSGSASIFPPIVIVGQSDTIPESSQYEWTFAGYNVLDFNTGDPGGDVDLTSTWIDSEDSSSILLQAGHLYDVRIQVTANDSPDSSLVATLSGSGGVIALGARRASGWSLDGNDAIFSIASLVQVDSGQENPHLVLQLTGSATVVVSARIALLDLGQLSSPL